MLRLPPFRLLVPRDVADGVALKAQHGGEALFVAGGTDLFPNMKRGVAAPRVLIRLDHLDALSGVRPEPDGRLRIGAAVRLSEVSADPAVRAGWPALAEAAGRVGTPVLREMGTIGGNLLLDTRCNYYDQSRAWRKAVGYCRKKDGDTCWVAPSSSRCWAVQASDTAPVAVALSAVLELVGSSGTRSVPADRFYRDDGVRYLAKEPDELVTAVTLPPPAGVACAYLKVSRRGSFDFPVLGVAVRVRREAPRGPVVDARVVLGAIASAPLVVDEAAAVLVGRPLDPAAVDEAAEAAWRRVRPMDNTDGALGWRKAVVRTYVRRALDRLAREPMAPG